MKKLLLIIFALFISYNMYSQTEDSIKYDISKLDFSDAKTGHLVDYGFHTIKPYEFNSKTDTVKELDIRSWLMVYQAIDNGNIDSNKVFLPPTKNIKGQIKEIRNDDKVDLFILSCDYNYLDPNGSFEDYFSKEDSAIIDKSNRKKTPYLKNTILAVSPEINQYNNLNITFNLQEKFYFSSNEKHKSIEVDFGDGTGYRKITIGNSYNIKYSSSGKKSIKIKAKIGGGEYLYSNTYINIQMEISPMSLGTAVTKTATKSYNGSTPASGTYQVDYAYGRSFIKKPLIIVEGFDPNNQMNYYSYKYKIDYTHLHYDYDIVFVNFNNTTDYIENNAYLLRDIVKEVNNSAIIHGGIPNETVMVSFSMGGLITNYALSYMESINEDHNVKLNFSWDTPHRGANVPSGLQWLVKFADDSTVWGIDIGDEADIAPTVDMLTSKAAQEMLITHAYTPSNETSDFLTRYHQLGLPNNCKNLAIANGNTKGDRLGTLNMGEKIFNYHYWAGGALGSEISMDAWADGYNNVKVFRGEVWNVWFGVKTYLNEEDTKYSSEAIDNSPGGIYDTDAFGISEDSFSEPPYGSQTVNLYKTQFTFIPTLSALDMSFSLGSDHDIDNISACDTPFDNIYIRTTEDNQLHIDSDAEIRSWVNYQIDNYNGTDCQNTSYCNLSENYIEEYSYHFCENRGYGLANAISVGATYKWSLENHSGIDIAEGEHSSSVGIEQTGSIGYGTLKLTLTTACGSITYKKDIWLGRPENVSTLYGPSVVFAEEANRFYATIPEGATSLEWSLPSGWSITSSGSTYAYIKAPDWYGGIGASIMVRGKSSCGSSTSWTSKYVQVEEDPFGGCDPHDPDCLEPLSMNSNPTQQGEIVSYELSEDLYLESSESKSNDISQSYLNISIYDLYGNILNEYTVPFESGHFPTDKLPKGINIVKFKFPNKEITKKLIIN